MSGSRLGAVPDDELDAHIADLIVQKARAKQGQPQAQVEDDGSSSSAGPSRVAKTNKKFLASVLRNVEGHNQALLRQQARKAEREERGGGRRSASPQARSTTESDRARLRGWSDHEHVEDNRGFSSKMDRYFEDTDRSPEENKREEGEARRRHHPHRSDSTRSERRKDERSSKYSSSSSHRDSRDHRSRHSHDDDRDGRSHHHSSRKRKHRDREQESKQTRSKHHDSKHRCSHRSDDKSKDREKPSPEAVAQAAPKKVREWDLGKSSLAF